MVPRRGKASEKQSSETGSIEQASEHKAAGRMLAPCAGPSAASSQAGAGAIFACQSLSTCQAAAPYVLQAYVPGSLNASPLSPSGVSRLPSTGFESLPRPPSPCGLHNLDRKTLGGRPLLPYLVVMARVSKGAPTSRCTTRKSRRSGILSQTPWHGSCIPLP